MNTGRGSTIGPMSGTPTAICGNIQMGLPACERGQGKYCYWMKVCSSQMRLDDPEVRTRKAQILYDMEKKKALDYAEEYAHTHQLDDRQLDGVVDELLRDAEYMREERRRK